MLDQLPADGHLLKELDFISEPKAAIAIGLTTQSLIKYRKNGNGPPYTQIGRQFFYSLTKLKAWIEAGGIAAEPADKPRRVSIKRKSKAFPARVKSKPSPGDDRVRAVKAAR